MKKIINNINNYIINNFIIKHLTVVNNKLRFTTVTVDNFERILKDRTLFLIIFSILLYGLSILIYGLLISYFVFLFLLGMCYLHMKYMNYVEHLIKKTDGYKKYKKNLDEAKQKAYAEFNRRSANFNRQYNKQCNNGTNTEINNAFKLFKISINSNETEIKRKYKELVLIYHPDKYTKESEKEIATRNFQKLNAAYDVIKKYKNIN